MNQTQLLELGIIIILLGFLIIISSAFMGAKGKDVRFSVFGLFGFIPFGIANDKRLFFISIAITLVLLLMTISLFYKSLRIQ